MGFNLMYYFPMCGLYFFMGSNLEKKWKILEKRIRPDWGNTARADMAGLGSVGLNTDLYLQNLSLHIDVFNECFESDYCSWNGLPYI